MSRPRRPKILFIDDDPFSSSSYVRMLRTGDLRVDYVKDVDSALDLAGKTRFDAVIIDIMMPQGKYFNEMETAAGFKTGLALGIELTDLQPDAVLLALTNSKDADVEAWYTYREEFDYYYKGDVTPDEFAKIVWNKIQGVTEMPKIFIVHGHDQNALLSLKNFLQNTLGLPEPIILAEQPSKGMTLIEKFEHYAEDSDVVFALFTPDDFSGTSADTGRARQNVLFEYGFFLGALGRRSGRVLLLYKQGTENPSDLHGLIYVDITNGIEAAGEQIRRELRGLFPSIK
jgi:DNA-binding NarL/FixJ family response regulator